MKSFQLSLTCVLAATWFACAAQGQEHVAQLTSAVPAPLAPLAPPLAAPMQVVQVDGLAKAGDATPLAQMQRVEVRSLAHPDRKTYVNLVKGVEMFGKYRHFSPRGQLRFKVHARQAGVDMHDLTLKIVGDSATIAVALDSELRFELPIDQTALKENADVVYNRRDGALSWRPEVRSPGLPPHTRRLGDLRLECRVDVLGAHIANGFNPLGFVIDKLSDPCGRSDFHYHFYADQPVFSVTLSYGGRRQVLMSDALYGNDVPALMLSYVDWSVMRDRVFLLPLGDAGWPDDSLVQFDYMDDGAAPSAGATGTGTAP